MLNSWVHTLDVGLAQFEKDIKARLPHKNFSYINYSSAIADLISQAKIPSIVLFAENMTLNGFASLGEMLNIHTCFNAIFIDRIAQEILSPAEIEFVIGHEVGHTITGDCEKSADLAGIQVTSPDVAITFLEKLPVCSQMLSLKYGLKSHVPTGAIASRINSIKKGQLNRAC